jgi:hypothetical protein
MLATTEWTLVTELTRDHLVDTVEPRDRLARWFTSEFVADLSLGTRASANATALVEAVRRGGLRGPDPPMLRLLNALLALDSVAVLPDSERLRAMLRREQRAFEEERNRRARTGDPFRVYLLRGNEAFIDRVALRDALQQLTEDPTKLVLQVTGAPSIGKSYSYQLISFLSEAEDIEEFTPALVRLNETSTPLDIVRMLGLQVAPMESPPPPEDDRQKWNGYAALWLVSRAAAEGGRWWFVLDGLNHLAPTSPVHDFVQELALSILTTKRARIRLVLLGYEGQLPADLRRRYLFEEVRKVTEPDLREFFTSYFCERNGATPDAEAIDREQLNAEIDATIGQVLEFARKTSANGEPYMRALGRAVEGVIDELAG